MSAAEAKVRRASHAGSWYEKRGAVLAKQLQTWLDEAKVTARQSVRAIIVPHAGYSYSGRTAAYSYKQIQPDQTDRIIILGPSHHHYTRICELPCVDEYETPLANLKLDTEVIEELRDTGMFDDMDEDVDEAEHSIEMQLPYLSHVMGQKSFTVVPILVGGLSVKKEEEFGKVLAPYLQDARNLFVISSDFCHWGKRFSYTYYDEQHGSIWKSIQALDEEGVRAIQTQDPARFSEYLAKYKNTICGRHPIGVMLQTLKATGKNYSLDFLHYEQSSQCQTSRDSSVSYVSLVVTDRDTESTNDAS